MWKLRALFVLKDKLMEPKVSLIGLGNILMMDEGVGVHAVNAVQELYEVPPQLEIVDGGTSGLDLLPYLEGRERVLIVDAVDFGKEPGFMGMLENDDIPAAFQIKASLHHLGLLDVIATAKLLGKAPQEICLIGIQPQTIDLGVGLSPLMQEKLGILIDRVLAKLSEWDLKCVRGPSRT
jgi:hydrogenase maturation protease